MNSQARKFFDPTPSKEAHFHAVRWLHEEPALSWENASPTGLPRSWFELSRIRAEERIEFLKEFWLLRLPFHPKATHKITSFFDRLDDIGVVLTQQTKEEPWLAHLVYSLADDSSFFHGRIPADEEEIDWIDHLNVPFPRDFLAFLRIHNGFGRLTELSFFPIRQFPKVRERIFHLLLSLPTPLRFGEGSLNPHSLFPFYEEYGVDAFQCFTAEWYPGSEMGNVHFSAIDGTISDVSDPSLWNEEGAYPSFIEWLASFLEGMSGAS